MTASTTTPRTRGVAQTTPSATTRRLLACGVAAGPLYVIVATGQVLAREGFDIRHHAVSLLSNGDLGWIQIANFVASGALTIACAVGLRRALGARRGGTWGPRLLAVYGASLVAAGVFVADPAMGFPVGTPEGPPSEISWHGLAHFAAGGVGFMALVAACLVLAGTFADQGHRGWALHARLTGAVFLTAFAGIASGGGIPALTIAFTVAVVLAWAWISITAARVLVGLPNGAR